MGTSSSPTSQFLVVPHGRESVPCPELLLTSLTLQNDSSAQLPEKKQDSPCLGQETET